MLKGAVTCGLRYVGNALWAWVLAGLLVAPVLQAASDVSEGKLGPLLNQISAAGPVEGAFSQQKMLADMDSSLDSRGSFTFSKDAGLQWRVEAPISTQLQVSAEGIVQSQGGTEVLRLDAAEAPLAVTISQILLAVFAGDFGTLEEHFVLAASGDTANWTLVLVPRTDVIATMVQRITVEGGNYLTGLFLEEANGDSTRILLHSISSR